MQGEFSILRPDGNGYDAEETATFYQDLNLLQVIDRLSGKWGREIRKYFMYLPEDPKEGDYRRAVYGDIKKEPVYRALMAFTEAMNGVDKLRGERTRVSDSLQRSAWLIREAEAYCGAYVALHRELSQAELESEGMLSLLAILTETMDGGYREIHKLTAEALTEIRKMRFVVTYEKARMRVEIRETPGEGAYDKWLNSEAQSEDVTFVNPFLTDAAITELERACLTILKEKNKDFFRRIQTAAKQCERYQKTVLLRFEQEVLYYLSYATLQREMEKAGHHFATPATGDGVRMEAKGLYDIALAIATLSDGRKVIANDFYYGPGERFFVLTGPNQGGKTTFARSLGQLVYLTRMGLDVPAESASVPYFSNIQTHFSVEESVETGRGKLMDELVRLAPMMAGNESETFVVINELFTTAANYDAQIMGKRVLEHFISRGFTGIYVTHLKELAEDRDGVVSLRAMLNDRGIQTFEIRRGEAEDSACAANQVNKYRLSYEQLKERL